ncbi:MAG: Gx transporter family protein, partial [Ruminococcus sp.]|nr:Gx transporter family protein [Ruminococcus sp.]
IITVYSVYHFKASETIMLVVSRVILGSFFSGNLSASIYSMSGAIFCLLGMLCIRKIIPEKYIWLCSIAGAIFHNIGQICVAVTVMNTFAVITYLPILIFSGCIAGFFTGMCAFLILRRLSGCHTD